ncbi:MAG TPA: 30S ribosomal protein S1 [Armatimonadota bacterium]|nr:30S ribosomal protein S1 [Armatimonadota bacterium]
MSWTNAERPLDDAAASDSEKPEMDLQTENAGSPPEAEVPAPTEPSGRPPDAAYDETISPLKQGDIVSGLVVHVDNHGALVDVGTKSEGMIPLADLAGENGEPAQQLAVGDRIDVYVVRTENAEGGLVLSKRKADYENVWRGVIEAYETGATVSAMVTDRVKGGLVVDLGLRGFLPASHVATRNVRALERFVGQSVKLKILEVDRGRKRVVVSHRLAMEEERQRKREQTLAMLEEGQVRKGMVRRVTDYGAFVDLGGIDGLLHVTEMSWARVRHPSDVVKPGDKIDVLVLKYDREQDKVSLGLKQILPDPWQHVEEHYAVGSTVTGRVSRVVPFGAFVQLEGGIEAIIPNSELTAAKGAKAEEVLREDQEVQAKIIALRPAERRMTLSIRHVQQDKERRQLRDYMEQQKDAGRVTVADLVGDVFSQREEEE